MVRFRSVASRQLISAIRARIPSEEMNDVKNQQLARLPVTLGSVQQIRDLFANFVASEAAANNNLRCQLEGLRVRCRQQLYLVHRMPFKDHPAPPTPGSEVDHTH